MNLFFYKRNLSLTYKDNVFYGDTVLQMFGESYEPESAFIDSPDFDFSPSLIWLTVATQHFESVITPNANTPTIEGIYYYTLYVETYAGEKEVFYITLNVIGESTDPPEPEKPDTIKYLTEYKDLNGADFRIEIWQKGFKGLTTNVRGYANLKYQSKKDLFEPIIASALTIYYEATEALSMTDLYSEAEQTYKVVFKRNGTPIFIGFIKPDGIFEDWVSNRWILDVDAIDGLSTLKNLSFVTDNGNFYIGKLSILEAVKNCLHRTGLDLPINISLNLFYEGYSGESILEKTFVNTERYYQDTRKVMDCESVMKSLLQIFNATLIQMNGEWWIYRSIDVTESMVFSKYIDGIFNSTFVLNPTKNIGSHINNFEIFHCNENQKKSIAASVQAYRVYYKYGNTSSLASNSELMSGSGLSVEGWTVNNSGFVYRNPSGYGIILKNNDDIDIDVISLNQSVLIKSKNTVRIEINLNAFAFIRYGYIGDVYLYISSDNYYFTINDGWILKSASSDIHASVIHIQEIEDGSSINWNTEISPFPEDSRIYLKITADIEKGIITNEFQLYFNSISILPSNSNIKGVYYTAQRTTRISSVTKEDVTVYNGDSLSDLFVGTLYKSDGYNPTEKWYRQGKTESLEILNINAQDNLRISPRPMMIFEGDIYGYIPYLSLITINNITGKFLPTEYTYKTADNVIELSSKEFSSDYLDEGAFRVEREVDNGNETKVTIK